MPQLCRVDEATRIDVSSYLLQTTELYLLYLAQMGRFSLFLKSLGANNEGFAAVCKLDFQLFGRHHPSAGNDSTYIELMKRYTKLTQVQLKFEVD